MWTVDNVCVAPVEQVLLRATIPDSFRQPLRTGIGTFAAPGPAGSCDLLDCAGNGFAGGAGAWIQLIRARMWWYPSPTASSRMPKPSASNQILTCSMDG